ncbi:MAG: YebC/PmpR family DNA-binding transcriptional regulator [Chloroflexi bacterium]|nr:YebC/PmpR family DNA-binding transcriptional regulator [Chloroflexota bacterium]
MSKHSKWSTIKRAKGVTDAKRGQVFTKIAREIIVATRQGGGDPEGNFKLRLIMDKARKNNMPNENVERAIKKGLGEAGEAAALSEIMYEGYAPGGAAVLVQALTDNKNRTTSEIRNVFARSGGSLGESGCVAWNFEPRGILTIETDEKHLEEIELFAIDAGADDVKIDGNTIEIYTLPADMETVRKAIQSKKLNIIAAEFSMVPQTLLAVDEKSALQTLKLLDKLEEIEDVQHVYTNADFPEKALEDYQS